MSYFFKHVLPPVRREFDIDRIYGHCIKNKELLKRGRSKRYTWKGVKTNSMGMSSDGYKSIFSSIYTAITQAAQETSSSGSIQPRFVPVTNEQSNTFIHLEDPHDNYPEGMERKHLYNTAFSLHFKRSKRDTFDVSLGLINCSNLKLTSCLQNIQQLLERFLDTLSHDPCRRFVLGATIEGTSMRLWTYSRSMIIASETLDFCSVSYYISFVGIRL